MNKEIPVIVPRYRADDWSDWVSLCSDTMCDSWEQWNAGIEDFFDGAARGRNIVHAVTIRPRLFQEWAEGNDKPLDGHARAEYAAWLVKDRFLKPTDLPKNLPKHAEVNRLLRRALKANPDLSLSDISDPYLRRPEAGICPLFRQDETGPPEHFGSSVLIRIADHHFLVSAAHVFDSFKTHAILIPGHEHLIEISGEYRVTSVSEGESRETDEIDLGYFHFRNGLDAKLHRSLLFLDELDCNAMDSTKNGDAYTVIGYRAELSRTTSNQASTEISRITCEGVMDHRYEKLGLNPNTHLLLQYRMRKGVSQRTLVPGVKMDFGGISGGGAFAWSKDLPDPRALAQPSLIGIVTAYAPHHNVFQITRLGHVLAGILKEFPNLPLVEIPRQLETH